MMADITGLNSSQFIVFVMSEYRRQSAGVVERIVADNLHVLL